MFLMLYLIYTQAITVGQFFSLFIYSFFIFGPLQELGNVINVYRETEASLLRFQAILDTPIEPKPANPVAVADLETLSFDHVTFTHLTGAAPALTDVSFSVHRGETVAFVGPSGAGKSTLVKLLVGLYRPQDGRILLQRTRARHGGPRRPARAHRLCHPGDAAVFRVHPGEPALRSAGGHRRRVPGRAEGGGLRQPARARGQGARYGHRRGRGEGVGRRASAPLDRPRAAPPAASAGLRRSDVVTRLDHRGGNQPDDSRRQPRRGRRSRSSLRIASRRSCTPIASTSSNAAGSSRRAVTTRCSRSAASITRCGASRWASGAVSTRRRIPSSPARRFPRRAAHDVTAVRAHILQHVPFESPGSILPALQALGAERRHDTRSTPETRCPLARTSICSS